MKRERYEISPIAHIYTDFSEKFGIPRQSGLVEGLIGKIVFEPEYASVEAIKGLEEYSHIWLIWQFSEVIKNQKEKQPFKATVRPPRLGGNTHMGVFATRSPFRPNGLGLSCVALDKIEISAKKEPIIWVRGVDMLDGTPIYDIKPYLPYVDKKENAKGGFAEQVKDYALKVSWEDGVKNHFPEEKWEALIEVLASDPRPSYQKDDTRIYGMKFAGYEIKFRVEEETVRVLACKK